ncbi:MAG TPA: hypothetical protein VGC77_00020 [Rhodopseudomonas sp.]|uniref:hypothetical protein n=1 Tax=Rhodopseudomonas sp. TaxID=1078 RepID=UPI002ED82F43
MSIKSCPDCSCLVDGVSPAIVVQRTSIFYRDHRGGGDLMPLREWGAITAARRQAGLTAAGLESATSFDFSV